MEESESELTKIVNEIPKGNGSDFIMGMFRAPLEIYSLFDIQGCQDVSTTNEMIGKPSTRREEQGILAGLGLFAISVTAGLVYFYSH